jgi:zinc D-Ala-D-Ala carboxypeptidase
VSGKVEFESVQAIQSAGFNWRWPHVNVTREWACKGTGRVIIVPEFLDRFERLRKAFGRPLIINSGYRSPVYNSTVSSTGLTGPHTTGRAMDIRIYGHHAYELVQMAQHFEFTGIGLKQHGPQGARFVHLDDLAHAVDCPRPWVWTY